MAYRPGADAHSYRGSVASWYQHGLPNAHVPGISSRLSSYITVLAQEWLVVLLIWLALRRRGLSIGTLVSGRWPTLGSFFKDLGLAVGFLVVAIPLVGALAYLLGGSADSALANITPKTAFELVVWLALAVTGGFGEELTFRGYLTRQFSAWTGSRAGCRHGSGMASGTVCPLAQEPAPRNAGPRTARRPRRPGRVLLMKERNGRVGQPASSVPDRR